MGDQLLQTLIYKEVTTVWFGKDFYPDARPNVTLRGLCPLFFFLLNLEQRNPYLIQICGFNLKVKSNKGMWLKNVRHKSLKKMADCSKSKAPN